MASFKDEDWANRFGKMGDQAEQVFEEWCKKAKIGYARYGLNRPAISLNKVPPFIRYTPDYLMSFKLVEVQGFGEDGLIKVKLDKLEALSEWDAKFGLDFFLYDSKNKRFVFVSFAKIDDLSDAADVLSFPEGKQYYAIQAGEVDGWEGVV